MLGATLAIPLDAGGCRLDRASVEGVEPATFQVLETRFCGGILCWHRYVVTEGKRIDLGQACEEETAHGNRENKIETKGKPTGFP